MTEPRKYRGIADGKWVKGWYLKDRNHHFIFRDQRPDGWDFVAYFKKVIPETVGQSTGREDSQDKEIAAGDKVSFTVFDHNGHDTQYQGVITWGDCEWVIEVGCHSGFPLGESFSLGSILKQDDEFEVIGSIHDHLLKGAE